MNKETKTLEAILFLKGRVGSDITELKNILGFSSSKVKKIAKELEDRLYEEKSIYEIKWSDDSIRLTIVKEIALELSEKIDRTINVRLSKSVIETLTIIAYNQPTTKPEVEKLRGVASDYSIRKLQDYNLIRDIGKSDLPGQPNLYETTPEFLNLFDLKTIEELPIMENTFEEQTTEMVALFDRSENETDR